MDIDRAIARWSRRLQRVVALSFLTAGLFLCGCRGTVAPDEKPAPFVLTAGDRLVYDGWSLDALGFTVDSTMTRRTWDVLSTTATGGGYSDAIMVRERSVRVGTTAATVDTFFLRVTPDGTVLRYGFLAELVLRREGRTIPRRWDTLSIPDVGSWIVGQLDSAGRVSESATVPADGNYFTVLVDSVSFIVPTRRVEMSSDHLEYVLWISTAPPCFPRLEEDPDFFADNATGSLLLLRELQRARR